MGDYIEKNIFDELQKLKEKYKKIRNNTHCIRTETDDCDRCRADHYLDARLKTVDDCITILVNLGY